MVRTGLMFLAVGGWAQHAVAEPVTIEMTVNTNSAEQCVEPVDGQVAIRFLVRSPADVDLIGMVSLQPEVVPAAWSLSAEGFGPGARVRPRNSDTELVFEPPRSMGDEAIDSLIVTGESPQAPSMMFGFYAFAGGIARTTLYGPYLVISTEGCDG